MAQEKLKSTFLQLTKLKIWNETIDRLIRFQIHWLIWFWDWKLVKYMLQYRYAPNYISTNGFLNFLLSKTFLKLIMSNQNFKVLRCALMYLCNYKKNIEGKLIVSHWIRYHTKYISKFLVLYKIREQSKNGPPPSPALNSWRATLKEKKEFAQDDCLIMRLLQHYLKVA